MMAETSMNQCSVSSRSHSVFTITLTAKAATADCRQKHKYRCSSCKYLLRDAVQPSCGHWLCQSCAEELFQNAADGRGVLPKCPDCGEELTQVREGVYFHRDEFVRREIRNLAVQCCYHEQGCTWKGKFIDYWEHKDGCRRHQLEAVCDMLYHSYTGLRKTLENGKPRDQFEN